MTVTDLALGRARVKTRMPPEQTRTLRLDDLAAVRRLGAALAGMLRTGDVVLLRGDLGAGKTELARAIIQARMGADIEVPSPTFTLVQTYPMADLAVSHADLYRIERIEDLSELGLDEAMDQGALLVEWPERAQALWPASRLDIELTLDAEGPARIAQLTPAGDWIGRLQGAFA